jgi:hypothetical protein
VVGAGAQVALTRRLWMNASFDITRQELSFSYGEYVLDYSMSLGMKMAF